MLFLRLYCYSSNDYDDSEMRKNKV